MSEMVHGKIGIRVLNRTDGTPLLELKATDAAGRKLMTSLYKDLIDAQLLGITKSKADIFNVCGSQGTVTPDERSELFIPLALGGIGLRRYQRMRAKK